MCKSTAKDIESGPSPSSEQQVEAAADVQQAAQAAQSNYTGRQSIIHVELSYEEASSSLRSLYYFATPTDVVLIVCSCLSFAACGGLQSSLQLIIGEALASDPEGEQGEITFEPAGRRAFDTFLYVGIAVGLTMAIATITAQIPKFNQLSRWKVEFLKAIMRQEVSWYDLNKPQELAGRMGEVMLKIERAHAVTTYLAFMPLGQFIGGIAIAMWKSWTIGLLSMAMAVVLVVPAAFIQMRTITRRAHWLAEAYGAAGAFSAEVLGAIRTVSSLGMEKFVLD
eukprot:1188633-Prymnesium_polylepis.1